MSYSADQEWHAAWRERRATQALVVVWAFAILLGFAISRWHWQGAAAAAAASYLGLVGLLAQRHVLRHEVMDDHPYVMCLPWALLAGVLGGSPPNRRARLASPRRSLSDPKTDQKAGRRIVTFS